MFRATLFFVLFSVAATVSGFEPSGTYKGGWKSLSSGHKGAMRVKFTPRSDGKYDARFSGRFAVIIPFTYKTTMTPIASSPGHTTLQANKRLPIFGNFKTTAEVTPCGVNARYESKSDHGSFIMQRVR